MNAAAPSVSGAWGNRSSFPASLVVPVLLAFAFFVLVPCAILLVKGLEPAAETGTWPDFTNFDRLIESKIGQQALSRTLRVSLIVTLVCILAGYPVALFIARRHARWRGLLLAIVIFPFLISAVVRAFGWTVMLGDNGLVNKGLIAIGLIERPIALVQNEIGIIVGETHLLMPYMVLSLLAVIQRIDPNLKHAAESLGASPVTVFWKVVVPLTMPGLLTGTLLVFSLAMTAFATPFLLGGGRTPILTTLLYQYAFTLYDWRLAATIGIVLLILGIIFVAVHRFATSRGMRSYG